MSAHYRVKEHRHRFTPQRRVLGVWFSLAKPQNTMDAANQIIREKVKARHPQTISRAR
jgi:hypothetical protein